MLDPGFDAGAFSDEKRSHDPIGDPNRSQAMEIYGSLALSTLVAVIMAVALAIQQRVNPLAMLRSNVGQGVVGIKDRVKACSGALEQAPTGAT